jgi:hypothetical protein
MRQLEARPGFEVISYWERGWRPQDLVVCTGTRPAP